MRLFRYLDLSFEAMTFPVCRKQRVPWYGVNRNDRIYISFGQGCSLSYPTSSFSHWIHFVSIIPFPGYVPYRFARILQRLVLPPLHASYLARPCGCIGLGYGLRPFSLVSPTDCLSSVWCGQRCKRNFCLWRAFHFSLATGSVPSSLVSPTGCR